jgi:aromatic ring-opening dioxygenase catalytic subunit (LigB family)
MAPPRPSTRDDWLNVLDSLPAASTPGRIPAFFFSHGSPLLLMGADMGAISESMGPKSPMAVFLQDFGPALLKKYNPKGIVVFSAHWESELGELQGNANPWLIINSTDAAV